MKFSDLLITSTIFLNITMAYADPEITFEQYNKGVSYKTDGLHLITAERKKFQENKRPFTTQENFDHMCSINNISRETVYYINQYPTYKKMLEHEEKQKVEDIHKMSNNFIKKYNVKCSDYFVMPPYSSHARWKELPPLNGNKDAVIAYVDTNNYKKISPINGSQVVNIKELFKNNPDYYIEQDYLIFCKTKEEITTRIKMFLIDADGVTINSELTSDLPLKKEPMNKINKRIFDYTCKNTK